MRVTTSFGFLLAFVFMVPAGAWVSDYSILSDKDAAREITDWLGEGRVALSKLLRRPDAYVSGRMDWPPLFEGYGDFHFSSVGTQRRSTILCWNTALFRM